MFDPSAWYSIWYVQRTFIKLTDEETKYKILVRQVVRPAMGC